MASEIIDRALFDFDDPSAPAQDGSPFKRLFNVWMGLQEKLKTATVDADKLLDAQSTLMSMAAHLPARSVEDVLYKLAFWRWDCLAEDVDIASLRRGDQIVLSAFRELAALTGESAALARMDARPTEPHSPRTPA